MLENHKLDDKKDSEYAIEVYNSFNVMLPRIAVEFTPWEIL